MWTIKREPTPPGEILKEEFLIPLGLSQKMLSMHIGCDLKVINRIINNRTSITPDMAVKPAGTFNTSPQFWLNAQQAVDIHKAMKNLKSVPRPIVEAG